MIWIDAHTGRALGVAFKVPISPVVNATQNMPDFYWKWGIADGVNGERPIYTTFRYKILRWAPTGTVADPNFPDGRPTWSNTPTEAWVEPVPSEPNPTIPPWDQWITAIHSSPAPTGPADTSHLATYVGSSGGDGSASWRWKAFRVTGSGNDTKIIAGGGTWRASMLPQEFATPDGGMTFYPVARVNDRGDGYGAKGNYTLGGQPSSIRTESDGRSWCIQGHYPGTGWTARPGRYTKNPAAENDNGTEGDLSANNSGDLHKERPHYFDPDNRGTNTLPAFAWESAGLAGLCLDHHVDGVEHYDGNWVMTADTKDEVEYIVSYAIPSWDQQFGTVGANWPNSVDPNSIFKPGWVGIHTTDGKIAPGANNAWKLPCYEIDEPILDPNGNAGTGFDYGYDGDVEVYPDASAPAGTGKALVLVAFGEYGFGAFVVSNVPPSGTIVSPPNVTVFENQDVKLTGRFAGEGTPLFYEWQKDTGGGNFVTVASGKGNLAKGGQNMENLSYSIPQAQLADAGQYRFVVGNEAGMLTSAVATVTVDPDTVPPKILTTSSVDGNAIDVTFDEPVIADTDLTDAFNYEISDQAVSADQVIVRSDGRSLRLVNLSGTPPSPFTLRVKTAMDLKSNTIPAGGITAQGIVQGWTDIDIGSPGGTNFSSTPGVFEVDAVAGDFTGAADSGHFTYRDQSGDFDVQVQIVSSVGSSRYNGINVRETVSADSANVLASWDPANKYQLRTRPATGGSTVTSGSACALNDPPFVWLRLTRAGNTFTAYGSPDATNWTQFATVDVALPADTLLGVASTSASTTGSTTTFSGFGIPGPLGMARLSGGTVELSWTGSGVLEAAPAVTGPWSSEGVSQENPQTITPTETQRFFRLR